MTMKSPKTKRVVRGWAVVSKKTGEIFALYLFRSQALRDMKRFGFVSREKVMHFEINLPTKKSAGKVGKRKGV
jgi:hypothetical protein